MDILAEALAAAGLTISTDKTQILRMPNQLSLPPQPPTVLPAAIQRLDTDILFFPMARQRGGATVTECPCQVLRR